MTGKLSYYQLDRIIIVSVSAFAFLSVVVSVTPFHVYGDGFSSENVYASIGNRKMAMFIKVNPPIITSDNLQDRYLQLRFFDAQTNASINNVSFWLNVTKGNQKLMYDLFYTSDGTIELKFKPGGSVGKWTVFANQQPQNLAWYSESNQVDVQSPILSQGGLYHFNMELLGFDYPGEFVRPYDTKVKFDSDLNVGDFRNTIVDYDSKPYNVTLVSFYDKIENIKFDPSKLQFSWSMPFDWNSSLYKGKSFLVHEELRVPDSLKEFVNNPTFSSTVNGIELNSNKRVVDPYTISNTTIMHLFILSSDMDSLSKKIEPGATSMDFVVVPSHTNVTTSTDLFSDYGGWQIKLGWMPPSLAAGSTENLQVSFFDQLTGIKTGSDVTYDLAILDARGLTIFSKTDLVAKGGNDIQKIEMPGNGIYVIKLSVKSLFNDGITDTSRIGTARGNLVIPSVAGLEEAIPEFPQGPIILIAISTMVIGSLFFQTLSKSKAPFYESKLIYFQKF